LYYILQSFLVFEKTRFSSIHFKLLMFYGTSHTTSILRFSHIHSYFLLRLRSSYLINVFPPNNVTNGHFKPPTPKFTQF